MEKYVSAEVEVIAFEAEDVITQSWQEDTSSANCGQYQG